MMHGEFSALADDYARYRPGYAPSVVPAILDLVGRPAIEIDAADVGAGTGIWTMMLAACGLRSIIAVEPDDEMRRQGILASQGKNILWRKGTGEETGLADELLHLVSMASSFHWVDFDKGCAEFQRIFARAGVLSPCGTPVSLRSIHCLSKLNAKSHALNPISVGSRLAVRV